MQLETLLDDLSRVEKRMGYFVARCPAHEDRNPSLSIREEDGKILLRCHAGCDVQDIVEAMGLTMSDLFNEEAQTADDEPEHVYKYTDEEGNLLYEVCRFPDKRFKQRRADGSWGLGDVRRVLYHLPEVRTAETIYLCEGEKDADAIRAKLEFATESFGITATCNPMGAGKWKDEYTESLKHKRVTIVADRDEPGRLHAERVAKSLEGKALSVEIVMPKTGKDAYDHLKAGYSLQQFIPYRHREGKGGYIVPAGEMADNAISDLTAKHEDVAGWEGPWGGVREIEFRPGRLYVVSGYTGDHKSAFALQVFRHLVEKGVRSAYFTLEMPERDIRNRLVSHKGVELWLADHPWLMTERIKEVYMSAAEEFRTWNADIIPDPSADADKVHEYVRDGEYDFIVFDHLHRIDRDGEEAQIAKEMRGFKNIALTFNIPVLLICQLRRMPPGLGFPPPLISDFKGSSSIEQEADMALTVYSHRDTHGKPDGTGTCDISILKNRHGTEVVKPVWFNKFNGTFVDLEAEEWRDHA